MSVVRGLKKTAEPGVHEGHNIVRFRMLFGLRQRELARLMHISQKKLSVMENTESLEEEFKQKIAGILGIRKIFLEMSDRDIRGLFTERSGEAGEDGKMVTITTGEKGTIHPIEKVTELYEEIRRRDRQIYEMELSRLRQENEELKKKK
ncbi:MAG: helix-turn-helix domain-containing protein [Bacteroides sp.]|nr:helix-turn-helix domain-containing protein [Bacteroides sp.]